jgi:glycosyltransferase involved in cell wall biosynthesis
MRKCLSALKGRVDKILLIDGAYKDFSHVNPYSGKDTLDVAKEYADILIEVTEPWEGEIVKRNEYLKYVPDGDYILMLDADEVLEGELPKELTKNEYSFIEKHSIYHEQVIQLFKKRPGMKYDQKHAWLFLDGNIINHMDYNKTSELILTATIRHLNHERPEIRQNADAKYLIQRDALRKERHTPAGFVPVMGEKKPEKKPVEMGNISFRGKHYCGTDMGTNKKIELFEPKVISVSKQKAQQLLKDFPNDWELV